MNTTSLTHSNVEDAYTRWAPVYDWAFALVMRPGRRASAAVINRLGGKVLDVGVGTGLELPMFGDNVRITGVDLCEPMLDIARKRVAEAQEHLGQLEAQLAESRQMLEASKAAREELKG